MRRSRFVIVLLGAGLLVGIPAKAEDPPADTSSASADVSLDKLAFVAGCWAGTVGEDKLQECWIGPEGDSMLGGFRWIKGGKLWMSEHLTFVDEGEHIVFHLRHFGADSKAWEEKDAPITAQLESLEGTRAVFKDLKEANRKFAYELTESGELHISIIDEKDGQPRTRTFKFTRM